MFDVRLEQHDPVRPSALFPIDGTDATTLGAHADLRRLAISTSAIRKLVDGSHPGKSMPAALRITLRPPSHPTRYSARSDVSPASSTSTPASSCAKPTTSRPEGSALRARRSSRPGCARSRSARAQGRSYGEWGSR